jgi:hypothetical protein
VALGNSVRPATAVSGQDHAIDLGGQSQVAGHPVPGHQRGDGDIQDSDFGLEPRSWGKFVKNPAEGWLGQFASDEQDPRPGGVHNCPEE